MRSKYEIKLEKELKAKGAVVDNKAGMGRWAKNRDFFNKFDLIYIDKKGVHWAAIRGHMGFPKAILTVIKKFRMPNRNIKEVWYWPKNKKKKQWRKKIIP